MPVKSRFIWCGFGELVTFVFVSTFYYEKDLFILLRAFSTG